MKRLATAALLAGCLVAIPAPAHAASANFTHLSPDNGYDGAFRVTCAQTGFQYMLYEGDASNCAHGVNSIYVFPGSEVWCRYVSPNGTTVWYKAWDATGSYSTDGTMSTKCVTHAD